MNEERARTRDRALAIGLPPSILAGLAGWYPEVVCKYLSGQKSLPSEFLTRLENTLRACEVLAASSPAPIKWSRMDITEPLVTHLRRKIEEQQIEAHQAKAGKVQ